MEAAVSVSAMGVIMPRPGQRLRAASLGQVFIMRVAGLGQAPTPRSSST